MFDLWGEEIPEDIPEPKIEKTKLFDCIKCVQNKTPITADLIEVYSPYVINDIFSNNIGTVQVANLLNIYHQIPPEAQFKFYHEQLPRGLWIGKKIKPSIDDTKQKLLDLGYSITEADEIMYVLDNKTIRRNL